MVRIVATVTHNDLPKLARQLPKEAERVVGVTLQAGYENVTQGMQAQSSPAPPGSYPAVVSGELIGSLRTPQQGAAGALEAHAPHAQWQEFGTRTVQARPFMTPAARVMRETLQREMAEAIKRLGG